MFMSFSAISDSMNLSQAPVLSRFEAPVQGSATMDALYKIAVAGHQKFGNALHAVSLYYTSPADSAAFIVATQYGQGADAAYECFYQTHIHGKAVPVAGTSLVDMVNGKKTSVFERSGYRADQYCYNFALGKAKAGDYPHYIVQAIFQTDADFKSSLQHSDLRMMAQIVDQSGVGTLEFSKDTPHMFDKNPPVSARDALVLYWDMSGYKKLARASGVQMAQQFTQEMRAKLLDNFQENYACDMLRSEGDGVWLSYPVTGFDERKMQDFTGLFLESAGELLSRYKAIRQSHPVAEVQKSFSKLALMNVSALDVAEQKSRFAPSVVESESFMRGRLLMDYAPRDRDVIVVDPTCVPLIAKTDRDFLKLPHVVIPNPNSAF